MEIAVSELLTPTNLVAPGDMSPEVAEAIQQWEWPHEMHVGDRVVFAHKPHEMQQNMKDRLAPGIVMRVDRRTVDIGCLTTGYVPKMACRHIDDPELVTKPHLLEDSYTGVFRLADSEIQQRANAAKAEELERLLIDAAAKLERLLLDVAVKLETSEKPVVEQPPRVPPKVAATPDAMVTASDTIFADEESPVPVAPKRRRGRPKKSDK